LFTFENEKFYLFKIEQVVSGYQTPIGEHRSTGSRPSLQVLQPDNGIDRPILAFITVFYMLYVSINCMRYFYYIELNKNNGEDRSNILRIYHLIGTYYCRNNTVLS